jgi:hypothetical protein
MKTTLSSSSTAFAVSLGVRAVSGRWWWWGLTLAFRTLSFPFFITPLLPLFSLLLLLSLLLLPLLPYPRGVREPVIRQALVVARGDGQGGDVAVVGANERRVGVLPRSGEEEVEEEVVEVEEVVWMDESVRERVSGF